VLHAARVNKQVFGKIASWIKTNRFCQPQFGQKRGANKKNNTVDAARTFFV
jgi:hypothetical protein